MKARGEFVVRNRLGLHARAAAKLCQVASQFSSEVIVDNGGESANAKSVMGLLLLCGSPGTRLVVVADGDDAEQAVGAVGALIDGLFGEGE